MRPSTSQPGGDQPRRRSRAAYYAGATVRPFVVAASFLGGMYVVAPGLNIAKSGRSAALGKTVSVEYLLIKLALAAVGLGVIVGLVDREFVELARLLRELGSIVRHAPQRALRRQHATPL